MLIGLGRDPCYPKWVDSQKATELAMNRMVKAFNDLSVSGDELTEAIGAWCAALRSAEEAMRERESV